jgi:hypothetical protein
MLFKDTSKLREFADLTEAVNFVSITPTIKSVEEQYIVPLIGRELYDALNTAYQLITDETTLSAANKNLLEYCRRVIGPSVCYEFAPKADGQLSDAGFRRQETGTAKTAYQYQLNNFREAQLRASEKAQESLLMFLEENSASYPAWISGKAFATFQALFIKTGSQFDECFTSASPQRNYRSMRSKMVDVEEMQVRAAIGDDLFDALKTKALNQTAFTDAEEKLIFRLKKAIAYLTVAFAVPYLNVRMDAQGLTIVSGSASTSRDNENTRTNADSPAISALIRQSAEAGAAWLKKAVDYIEDHADEFPDWSADQSDDTGSTDTGNDGLAGVFGLT